MTLFASRTGVEPSTPGWQRSRSLPRDSTQAHQLPFSQPLRHHVPPTRSMCRRACGNALRSTGASPIRPPCNHRRPVRTRGAGVSQSTGCAQERSSTIAQTPQSCGAGAPSAADAHGLPSSTIAGIRPDRSGERHRPPVIGCAPRADSGCSGYGCGRSPH